MESPAEDDVASVTFEHDDGGVVVIVGSGAGGGTLANELCQKGIDVVIVEAGPRFKIADFRNDEAAADAMFTWKDRRIVTGDSRLARAWPERPTHVCKTVGGSTVHWQAQAFRFLAHEFQPRTTYGAIDGTSLIDWPLTLHDLLPYYGRAEENMGVSGRGGRPFHPATNATRVFALGAKRLGYNDFGVTNMAINSVPYDGRNACDQIGFCAQGCASGAKWSTLYADIPKAEASGRCEVRANCMALRVEHARGQATGVLYVDAAGAQHLQKARAVCVAANAIETARLLLNSESDAFPDGLANSSGQLGRNYSHIAESYVYGEFERPVHMHRGIQVPGLLLDEANHDPARGFAGGILMMPFGAGLMGLAGALDPAGWGRAYAHALEGYDRFLGVSINGADLPMADNRVSLDPIERDRYGLPVPALNIDEHPNEVAMMNYGLKQAAALLQAAGARRTYETPPHPASQNLGTCRMSAKPDDGVVNPWGRSHDVPNLFVSDGAQFASANLSHPTLTIVALAIRQAEHIAETMARGDL
jgi:choline dehydrogenase-like flavoprotein